MHKVRRIEKTYKRAQRDKVYDGGGMGWKQARDAGIEAWKR